MSTNQVQDKIWKDIFFIDFTEYSGKRCRSYCRQSAPIFPLPDNPMLFHDNNHQTFLLLPTCIQTHTHYRQPLRKQQQRSVKTALSSWHSRSTCCTGVPHSHNKSPIQQKSIGRATHYWSYLYLGYTLMSHSTSFVCVCERTLLFVGVCVCLRESQSIICLLWQLQKHL